MGLDLSLLPIESDIPSIKLCFSHSILSCERDRNLFEFIINCKNKFDVPEYFKCHLSRDEETGETKYDTLTHDAYGEKIKSINADDLQNIFYTFGNRNELHFRNICIQKYLGELPSNTKIVLYWD